MPAKRKTQNSNRPRKTRHEGPEQKKQLFSKNTQEGERSRRKKELKEVNQRKLGGGRHGGGVDQESEFTKNKRNRTGKRSARSPGEERKTSKGQKKTTRQTRPQDNSITKKNDKLTRRQH